MSAELIRFDRKLLAVLGALAVFVRVATAFGLHGSSIGVWNQLLRDRTSDDGVLLGTPKLIRGDEYGVTTLAMISQARARPDFPRANPSWGAEQAPLIFSLPVRHWSMSVRPQLAGFLVLDLERGFAFYWAMKAFLLASGAFLLLLLVTGNDFSTSLVGTTWIFFSGYTQWWYSTPAMLPETVGCVALGVVAAHYLALSPRRGVIALAALVLAVCLANAALSLYPPFQLPLFYLAVAIGIGSLVPRLRSGAARVELAFRIDCAGAVVLGVAGLLALFYADARPTIDLMLGTAYPGARTTSGGGVSLVRIFSGFHGHWLTEQSYPLAWANVCEASNFVLLFPVPLAAIAWRAYRRQPVSALEWSLAAYLVVTLSWLALGWPHALATLTGFGLSSGTRSLVGLGIGSIALTCVSLANRRVDLPDGTRARAAVAVALVAALALYGLAYNRETDGFASGAQIAVVALVGGAAGYALLARKRLWFALLVLVPELWSHGLVNPVARGLGPILETNFAREAARIVASDPNARWAVYGGYMVADLLKTSGANVVNGTKVVPPLDDLRVLDPDANSAQTYNRYAHVDLVPVNGPDVSFKLIHADAYAIAIDPKSELWRALGVGYVALPFVASDPEFLARTRPAAALPEIGLWIYAYR